MKKLLRFCLSVALAAAIAGCANPLRREPPPASAEPVGPPLKGLLALYIAPEVLSKNTQFIYYYESIWIPEGKILQQTAQAAFERYFSEVRSAEEVVNADVIVKVNGHSVLNPLIGNYYADAEAKCYLPDGRLARSFAAQGTASIGSFYGASYEAEAAYRTAFLDIARQVSASRECLGALGETH